MPCKIVINEDSGNVDRLQIKKLTDTFPDAEIQHIRSGDEWSADGYDTIVVCGGDGTLNSALCKCKSKKIYYAPCGTLNEACEQGNVSTVGACNGTPFCYVCAAGSFTEIGYTASPKQKQHAKAFAYLAKLLSAYRCHSIKSEIEVDGKVFGGKYTLLMVLKGRRCFGFRFNKIRSDNGLYLLAIKSVGKDSLLNRLRIFVPFFRVFLCGVRKPTIAKNWLMLPFANAAITLNAPQVFCVDGEKRTLDGTLRFNLQRLHEPIEIIPNVCTCRRDCKRRSDTQCEAYKASKPYNNG